MPRVIALLLLASSARLCGSRRTIHSLGDLISEGLAEDDHMASSNVLVDRSSTGFDLALGQRNASANGQLMAGMLFDGQWLLQRKVSATLSEFPGSISSALHRWSHERKLGRGSFGEAWEAQGPVTIDHVTSTRKVVLKIFYRNEGKGKEAPVTYLTPQNMLPQESEEIRLVKKECEVVQRIVAAATRFKDVGQDRFVNCYGVADSESKSSSTPLYAVLGVGGTSLDNWVWDHVKEKTYNREETRQEARLIIANLLQAVRTMSEELPIKLTHHDIKPANAVFDGHVAKLIDFGAVLEIDPSQKQRAIGTPAYGAPEYLSGSKPYCAETPWSYDVFALGLMYAEFMCPYLSRTNFKALVRWARSRHKQRIRPFDKSVCNVPDQDVSIMEAMMSFDCKLRPSPSQILERPPFNDRSFRQKIGELAGSHHVDVSSNDEELLNLRQSVFNVAPARALNMRRGAADARAGIEQVQKGDWTYGRSCTKDLLALPGAIRRRRKASNRQQCSEACTEYYDGHRHKVNTLVQDSNHDDKNYCCELTDNGPGGKVYCWVGYDGTMASATRGGIQFVKVLPITITAKKPAEDSFDQYVKRALDVFPSFNLRCLTQESGGWEVDHWDLHAYRSTPNDVEENRKRCVAECNMKADALHLQSACCQFTQYAEGTSGSACDLFDNAHAAWHGKQRGDSREANPYGPSYHKRISVMVGRDWW